MIEMVPKFVPSEFCLACEGCCRFADRKSVWRPKADNNFSLPADFKKADGQDHFLPTVEETHQVSCAFLNLSDGKCGIYQARPFECALYPFVLVKSGGAVNICVHKNCPYVQEKTGSKEYKACLEALKKIFNNKEMREFLAANKHLAGDYSQYQDELEFLFAA